ncbi:NADH:flavin oxidoreductase/NADH oxidase [Gemmatimonas sp.]|uniref:NADH:flavin oxidoreductase/NADH oxidase n=1 Tax=Gemmatimonas sp. TaxID=1962908 RepID=UPI00286E1BC9|nr:NADH:flavin oxidoreductase/NADH oxidase [Gemmatimonas sp.]
MSALFSPLTLRSLTLRNRVGVSPMCQYSSDNGFATDWHLVHLGAFATGGAGLVITEAAAVTPEGRISPQDLGIWDDAHIPMLRRITDFCRAQGTVMGIQLAHAGRKASTRRPWEQPGGAVAVAEGGWDNVMAPSAVPFAPNYPSPHELSLEGIAHVIASFRAAARRAFEAGFQIIELHAAHGYLLHEFLSPIANTRTDHYGGSFENRIRLTLEVTDAVRAVWPDELPLIVRISATDWAEGGWNVEESVQLATQLHARGVDLLDCSSGGLAAHQQITIGPGYQVPFARRIRAESKLPTAAVGLITDATQAEQIVADGSADMVFLARELLRNPRWPLLAAHALGASITWPPQYERARPR